MKRITFIEPVGSMQGKLSGNRKLTYPTRNNSAWDAPEGKSYATNYRPSYIGNLRARDGVTYFSTKVRSSVTMNGTTRLAQALLGATVSLTTSMMKNPQILLIIQTAYSLVKPTETVHKWTESQVRQSLETQQDIAFIGQSGWNYIANPFLAIHHAGAINITGINTDVLVKFWSILAPNPITFTINGRKGVAHFNDDFSAVISSRYNVLGLSASDEEIDSHQLVKQGDLFVSFVYNGETYAAVVDRKLTEQCDDALMRTYILTETAQDIYPL